MTHALTINTGSSTVRLDLVPIMDRDRADRPSEHAAPPPIGEESERLERFLGAHTERPPSGVAHRIVHGGPRFRRPTIWSEEVHTELEGLRELAPLHLPPSLRWIRAAQTLLPDLPHVLVFDTAFFADLPEAARTYALPRALATRLGLRRYGFHGLAHAAMARRLRELRPDLGNGGRVITLQLGSGCSAAALRGGRPIDTTMGFTPTEGLVMATRSGDVDPGLLTHLMRTDGQDGAALDRMLNESSGLLGLSEISGDMRVLCERDDDRARLAIEVFCYRIRKTVGAYTAALGGLDAIVFGGGVGEHSPRVRDESLRGLEALGIELDPTANDAAIGADARIDHERSRVEVRVVSVDEAAELAREARRTWTDKPGTET